MKNVLLVIAFLLTLFSLEADEKFTEELQKSIHFPENAPHRIGYIPLKDRGDAISQATWIHINSALTQFKKNPPACIILELNSPGGEVFAAERISDVLKEMDTQYGVPVICYINNWAISAGAMLAYSCRYIVVGKDSIMGAAEPITMGGEGKPETASEKINSALRADFANHASYFDRNPFIAEAMVDKDIILVKRDGKIIKLDSEEQIRKETSDPDIIISPKGKLLTLNASQLMEFGVADYEVKLQKRSALTEKELLEGVWPIEKSALGQISYLKGATIESYQATWQTQFLAFLSEPAVSSVLFMILLISLYVEISGGGFGVAGAMGLISLFLVILSSFALEALHLLEPILFIFGLALVMLEVFFFPTLGLLGVVGGVFVLLGLGGMLVPGIEKVSYENNAVNAAGEYVLNRLAWLSGAFLLALGFVIAFSRYVGTKFPFMKRIVLTDEQRSKEGLIGTVAPSVLTALPEVGQIAVVVSALRPAGKIEIGENRYDAVSTGGFLLEQTKVEIVRIEGQKIFVQERLS